MFNTAKYLGHCAEGGDTLVIFVHPLASFISVCL